MNTGTLIFKLLQEFALDSGVSFDILTISDHPCAGGVFISALKSLI